VKQRIPGFDFARGLAVLGMIFVNFKVVMSNQHRAGFMRLSIFSQEKQPLFLSYWQVQV
jgi:uncharacterized membrane protein YeiB